MSMNRTQNLNAIKDFLSQSQVAVAGISGTKTKFGNMALKELAAKGYTMYPVHHELKSFENVECYKSINELPVQVNALLISSKPELALQTIQHAKDRGIKHIWVQQGAENKEIEEIAKDKETNIITGHCILMFASGKGIHGFHAFMLKLFGKYPK
jgi:uncharacterized protein